MKLSKESLEILKNFAGINSNILIEPGKKIKTMSVAKNIFASATVGDEFPSEFAIYNLSEFLGVLSLFDKPELDFKGDVVTVTDEGSRMKVKYLAASKEILIYPKQDVKEPPFDVKLSIKSDDLLRLQKGAAAIAAPDLQICSTDEGIVIRVCDKKNKDSNAVDILVSDVPQSATFSFNLRMENMKMLPGEYAVAISSKGLSRFESKDATYFLALEADSSYTK
jgi:hypothetical protein